MLITDKQTTMKLNDRLTEFSKFGMTFHYLLEEGKITLKEIEDIFFSKDDEKSTFMYINTMRKIMPEDVDEAYLKYQDDYPLADSSIDEQKEKLNLLYTSKIINEIASIGDASIDKTYINTYNYLLGDKDTNNLSYSYGK